MRLVQGASAVLVMVLSSPPQTLTAKVTASNMYETDTNASARAAPTSAEATVPQQYGRMRLGRNRVPRHLPRLVCPVVPRLVVGFTLAEAAVQRKEESNRPEKHWRHLGQIVLNELRNFGKGDEGTLCVPYDIIIVCGHKMNLQTLPEKVTASHMYETDTNARVRAAPTSAEATVPQQYGRMRLGWNRIICVYADLVRGPKMHSPTLNAKATAPQCPRPTRTSARACCRRRREPSACLDDRSSGTSSSTTSSSCMPTSLMNLRPRP